MKLCRWADSSLRAAVSGGSLLLGATVFAENHGGLESSTPSLSANDARKLMSANPAAVLHSRYNGRNVMAWSASSAGKHEFTGPGADDVLSDQLVAEHRTQQRFRTRRAAQPRPPSASSSTPPAVPVGGKSPPSAANLFPDPAETLPGTHRDAFLLGANTRCMLGWCRLAIARAYAFGLYADEAAVQTGISTSAPEGDKLGTEKRGVGPAALTAMLDAKESHSAAQVQAHRKADTTTPASPGELSLVLMMNRDIPGDHLAHGFRNSALARLATSQKGKSKDEGAPDRAAALSSGKAAAGIGSSGVETGVVAPSSAQGGLEDDAMAQLSAFVSAFAGWTFVSGDEISLVWSSDGRMCTSFMGTLMPHATLTHPALIRALFDVYTGNNPVSARAKATFERNLGTLAESERGGAVIVRTVLTEHASRNK